MASIQACEPRIPGLSPDIRWPLFFGITAVGKDYPNAAITLSSTGFAMLYALRQWHHVASLSTLERTKKNEASL